MTATPPQGIDRDTLMEAFRFMPEEYRESATAWVLALVRPVEGVTLTPEEARLASWAVQMLPGRRTEPFRALVARLEAAQ